MRVVVQRVRDAKVEVGGEVSGAIGPGLLVLAGFEAADTEADLDWMAGKGVDRAKYAEAWKSFSVQSKTKRAVQQTQAYDITGVPTLVVDGKYFTSVSMTGSPEGLMKTLDELIGKARAERPKKK